MPVLWLDKSFLDRGNLVLVLPPLDTRNGSAWNYALTRNAGGSWNQSSILSLSSTNVDSHVI